MHLLDRRIGLLFLLVCCGQVIGCGGPADPEILAKPFDEVFEFEREVLLRDDPDAPLGGPAGLSVWQGRIVIPDQMLANVKVFDSEGQLLLTLGGRGEGPGEFAWPTGAAALPDGRLAIYDAGLQRMSFFSENGDFLDSWTNPVPHGRSFTVLPDGRIAFASSISRSSDSLATVHVLSQHGALVKSSGVRSLGGRPFEAHSNQVQVASAGQVVVSLPLTSNMAHFFDVEREVEWWAEIGTEVYRPVEWLTEVPSSGGLDAMRDWNDRQMLVMQPVVLDSTRILIRFVSSAGNRGDRRWDYVLADYHGATLATTRAPVGHSIEAADVNWIYGTRMDDSGNVWLRLYRLKRSARSKS